MLTPQKIQDLADPIESIYINITNELLVNIGRHISSPTWTHTAVWEIQKLSELGQLTQENAAIINKWIKKIPPEMRSTMEATRAAALDKLETQMEKAAEQGYVTPPVADSTVQVLKDLSDQAADKLNLVNTTMLQSSLSQYQRAINLTSGIIQRSENTQSALNFGVAAIASGTLTRQQAVRKAIRQISKEGITGFYDKSGRSWSPEAYVNMVMRTTVHNTAIQATKSRMADYGTDVFQISSHAGARPRCYPYQGWFCSWNNSSGSIELGDGSTANYRPLSDTSYGEPAGIFGINCGHYPIPIIPGLTIPHGEDNIQPEEENNKAYAESQQQRALEREIRAAKRVVEMGDDSKEAKAAVTAAQKKMREFINRTGRTRRYDRESLYGGATTAQKLNQSAPQNVTSQATTSAPQTNKLSYQPASTITEAEKYARDVVGIPNVSYKGLDIRTANAMNESLTNAFNYSSKISQNMGFYGSAQERNKLMKAELETYFTGYFSGLGYRNPSKYAKQYASSFVGRVSSNTYALAYSGQVSGGGITPALQKIVQKWSGIGVNVNMGKDYDAMTKSVEYDVNTGYHPVGTGTVRAIFDHEFGHQLDYAFGLRNRNDIRTMYYSKTPQGITQSLSKYGAKNVAEFIAEAYSEYVNNPTPRQVASDVGKIIDGEAKKP